MLDIVQESLSEIEIRSSCVYGAYIEHDADAHTYEVGLAQEFPGRRFISLFTTSDLSDAIKALQTLAEYYRVRTYRFGFDPAQIRPLVQMHGSYKGVRSVTVVSSDTRHHVDIETAEGSKRVALYSERGYALLARSVLRRHYGLD